jgi:hypothetical protein
VSELQTFNINLTIGRNLGAVLQAAEGEKVGNDMKIYSIGTRQMIGNYRSGYESMSGLAVNTVYS